MLLAGSPARLRDAREIHGTAHRRGKTTGLSDEDDRKWAAGNAVIIAVEQVAVQAGDAYPSTWNVRRLVDLEKEGCRRVNPTS